MTQPTHDAESDASIGRMLGEQYRLELLLGQGGMGNVYRGMQLSVNRPVAIKLISGSSPNQAEMIRRFRREAEATARLSHPNTVRLFDFGVTELQELYMVMELLEGADLGVHLRDNGTLGVQEALRITSQVLEALAEAHELGIVHRDLKPGNVFLSRTRGGASFVKVMDFGIAGIEQARDTQKLTNPGAVMGTPSYMSPEQARGKPVDARSDLYSLGVMLFEMLTGRSPYDADTVVSLLFAHVAEPPKQLAEVGATLPEHAVVQPLIDRLLAKSPDDRPPSAAATLEQIAALELAPAAGARVSQTARRVTAPVTISPETPLGWPRPEPDDRVAQQPTAAAPKRGRALVALALAGTLAAGAAFALWRNLPPPEAAGVEPPGTHGSRSAATQGAVPPGTMAQPMAAPATAAQPTAAQPTAAPRAAAQPTAAPGTPQQPTAAPGAASQPTAAQSAAAPGAPAAQPTVAPGAAAAQTAAAHDTTQAPALTAAPGAAQSTAAQPTAAPGAVAQPTAAPGTPQQPTAAPATAAAQPTAAQPTAAPGAAAQPMAAPGTAQGPAPTARPATRPQATPSDSAAVRPPAAVRGSDTASNRHADDVAPDVAATGAARRGKQRGAAANAARARARHGTASSPRDEVEDSERPAADDAPIPSTAAQGDEAASASATRAEAPSPPPPARASSKRRDAPSPPQAFNGALQYVSVAAAQRAFNSGKLSADQLERSIAQLKQRRKQRIEAEKTNLEDGTINAQEYEWRLGRIDAEFRGE